MHGKGLCRYKDGSVYAGDWINNKFSGYGYYKKADGTQLRGDFENGE